MNKLKQIGLCALFAINGSLQLAIMHIYAIPVLWNHGSSSAFDLSIGLSIFSIAIFIACIYAAYRIIRK